jgi:hypothetical protein
MKAAWQPKCVPQLIARLRNREVHLSESERTLLADLLETRLTNDALLELALETARSARTRRIGTRIALFSLVHYLHECGVSSELSRPVSALWCALADADRGISNELTDRAPYTGGTQKTIEETFIWAMAAARVTILIDGGMSAAAAEAKVAKAQKLNAKKLREFRKNIQRAHAPPRAQKYYTWLLEDLADPKGATRRHVLRGLSDFTETDFEMTESFLIEFINRKRG